MRRGWFLPIAATLGFAFLYLPIISLVIFSFNESRLVTVWSGFSTKWYGELFADPQMLGAAWLASHTDGHARGPWWQWVPLSLHAGWVSLAVFLNTAQVVVAHGLLSTSQMLPWTLVLFAGAALLVLTVVVRLKGNPWYAAAAVWGLVGVYAKQSESALAGASVAAYVALALAGLVAAVALAAWMRARRSPVPVRLSAG